MRTSANDAGDSKPCPYCGESIKKAARKCRFCGEWLDGSRSGPDQGKDALLQRRPQHLQERILSKQKSWLVRHHLKCGALFRAAVVLSIELILLVYAISRFRDSFEAHGKSLPATTAAVSWIHRLGYFYGVPLVILTPVLLFSGARLDHVGTRFVGEFWWPVLTRAIWYAIIGTVIYVIFAVYAPCFKMGDVIQ